jgi:hypothetical protein
MGETRNTVNITPKGTITTNAKGIITKTTSTWTSLVLFAVSIDIILTISPKFPASNKRKNPWMHHILWCHLPLIKPDHNNTYKNHP